MQTLAVPTESPASASTNTQSITSHLVQIPAFLKSCYVDGLFTILQGRFNTRQAAIILLATVPLLLTIILQTVPSLLFPTEAHHAYYHFAQILSGDSVSTIPFLMGAVTITLGLKVPVN